MASTTRSNAPAPDLILDEAMLAVELELMRTPAMARLNGARRKEISRGILEALNTQGVITGIPALEHQAQLQAA
ncbi:hypothetical protein GCM10023063_20260 [Arthrobacter methylotrophus]|uniref:Uncharacterized protein n=1 Tax=Arthrobacter methylotrophus TaxID=121291 RepID=A0ABV5UXP5_9MICC